MTHLRVGRSVYLAPGAVVLAAADVHLEDEVMLAYRALVTDGDHTERDRSYRIGPRRNAPVRIGFVVGGVPARPLLGPQRPEVV